MPARRQPNRPTLILASASPRRATLLRAAGYRFRILPARIPERRLPGESPAAMALRLATAKACSVAARLQDPAQRASDPAQRTSDRARRVSDPAKRASDPAKRESWVLGADTIVTLDGRVLGKPRDARDAARMLRLLGGRSHRVITGVALCARESGRPLSAIAVTWVRFRELSRAEIHAYVASGEPLDKAGAYAIQGGAAAFVTRIRGSRSNVIGLPMETLSRLLRKVP